VLEEHLSFLKKNLDKNETFIQDWIDGKINNEGDPVNFDSEEKEIIKKSRCLIFGLEFIDHKREGSTSSKRFDVLTRLNEGANEYVLIELKSPNAKVFTTKEEPNDNSGVSTTYSLSRDLSRAIPEISEYHHLLKNGSDVDWQRCGLTMGPIAKNLIVIGTRKTGDEVWDRHFSNNRHHGLTEVITYTDLIRKMETTIKNLKVNLR